MEKLHDFKIFYIYFQMITSDVIQLIFQYLGYDSRVLCMNQ